VQAFVYTVYGGRWSVDFHHACDSTPVKGPASAGGDEKTATVMFDYEAADANDLALTVGSTIVVTDTSDMDWWKGYSEGEEDKEGYFPASFVEMLVPSPSDSLSRAHATNSTRQKSVSNANMHVWWGLEMPSSGSADLTSLGPSAFCGDLTIECAPFCAVYITLCIT
jgi:hypothetical protein